MLLVPPACLHFKVLLTGVQQMYLFIDHAAIWPSLSVDLGMLSPFLTNSSSFDEMASLSRPLIGTDRSTPKSYRAINLASAPLHSLISMGNLGLAFLRC